MLIAKTKLTKQFKTLFAGIQQIIDEAILILSKTSIKIHAMDLSHICLFAMELKKKDFDEYKIDKKYEIGINLSDFYKILQRITDKEELSIIYDEATKGILQIEAKRENSKKPRKFKVKTIDIDSEPVNFTSLNKIEYKNHLKDIGDDLQTSIDDAFIFAEVLKIETLNSKLILSTVGNVGDMECIIEQDELNDSKIQEDSAGIFANSFLNKIMKVKSIANTFTMSLKSEAPLKIVFSILDTSKISYYLAPRVEDPEDNDGTMD